MRNTPAFPLNTPQWHESVSDRGFEDIDFTMGMTLRDYFAAKAMQGFLSNDNLLKDACEWHKDGSETSIALWAYDQADAMLKAREA